MTMNSSESQHKAIGGYFGFDKLIRANWFAKQKYKFQSARAAFVALSREFKVNTIWLPYYLCHTIIDVCKQENIKVKFYSVANFKSIPELNLQENEWIYLVNYFGVSDGWVQAMLNRFPHDRIILDYSQALHARVHRKVAATIYSPRKFFGVPDGGILFTERSLKSTYQVDFSSQHRLEHLFSRSAGNISEGYFHYHKAEDSLADSEPKLMSPITELILAGLDIDAASSIRIRNFKFLNFHLKHKNFLRLDCEIHSGPLCYPFLTDDPSVRALLLRNKIFTPTYWPECAELGVSNVPFDINCLIPLPIDQRYTTGDLEKIISVLC